jgi:hypothetical protein
MNNEDDVSYLDVPSKETEKVWCKIGEAGNLEFVDWDTVRDIAGKFDTSKPEDRTEQMLIAKLMFLVRQETIKECGYDKLL